VTPGMVVSGASVIACLSTLLAGDPFAGRSPGARAQS
jgi:hypothetical protein